MTKAADDLIASRNILEANISMFHQGKRDLYRVVAGELRTLLCDRPQSTLLPRLLPDLRLHPLVDLMTDDLKKGLVLQIPALLSRDAGGRVRATELFDREAQPIPLEDWLAQPLLNEHITVRELLRSVSDKEDSHKDPEYNETLVFTRGIQLGAEPSQRQLIVAIGEYILQVIDEAIQANQQIRNHWRSSNGAVQGEP